MKRDIFSQEHDLFRTAFKSFVEREVVPHQAAWREDGMVSREAWRKVKGTFDGFNEWRRAKPASCPRSAMGSVRTGDARPSAETRATVMSLAPTSATQKRPAPSGNTIGTSDSSRTAGNGSTARSG